MKLKCIGLCREYTHLPYYPSIRELVRNSPQEDEEKIVRYLRNGELWIASPGVCPDLVHPTDRHIGTPSLLTDSVWAWRDDLAYYVENYHVKLPPEFIETMRENNWEVPGNIDVFTLEGGTDWYD